MATVDVTCYTQLGVGMVGGTIQAPREPSVSNLQVAIGGASAQSAAFPSGTQFVRVHADAICRVAIGANPTASAGSMRFAAGQTEYFAVREGHKLACITST